MSVILDLISGSLTLFTMKYEMLHSYAVMKVTNEKKDISSFYFHKMNKKISMRAISVTVGLTFRLKV